MNFPRLTLAGMEVGVMANYYRYQEPGLMALAGNKYGARFSCSGVDHSGHSGRIELIASYGELQYAGSGVINNVPDFSGDARIFLGGDIGVSRGLTLTPFGGLGYRALFNDLRGKSSTGASGYRRESHYIYLPVGVSGRYVLAEGWRVGGNIEFDFLLRGQQYSKLSDVGAGLENVRNEQRSGYAWRARLSFEKSGFSVGPWVIYWKIPDSSPAYMTNGSKVIEPENNTIEMGLELGTRF